MKALVYYGPRNLEVKDIPQPEIGPNEILIRTRACSICSTDVKTVLHGHKLIKPPAVLGHEVAGEVVSKGSSVKDFEVGDRVAVAPYAPCGACYYCRNGREILCERLFEESLYPGGFAEYIRVPQRLVEKVTIKITESVTFEEASLLEPLACVLKSIQMIGYSPDRSVLVIGSGPMGLLHVMTLKKVYGASLVISSDILKDRLNVAKMLGADYTINAAEEDFRERVLELTDNRGVDVVFVDVPSFEAVRQAFSVAGRGGTICLFAGLPPKGEEFGVNLNKIHYDEVMLCGSFGFTPRQYHFAYSIVKNKRIDLSRLITHRVRLEEAPRMFEEIAKHRTLKVTVVF